MENEHAKYFTCQNLVIVFSVNLSKITINVLGLVVIFFFFRLPVLKDGTTFF